MKYITTIGEREFLVEILANNQVSVDGVVYHVDFQSVGGQPVFTMLVDGKSYEAHIYQEEDLWHVLLRGSRYIANVEDEREKRLRAESESHAAVKGEHILKAPMPGLVVKIPVKDGEEVEKGDVLLILESMKMQNELKAPRAGTIRRIRVSEGDNVEHKEALLGLE